MPTKKSDNAKSAKPRRGRPPLPAGKALGVVLTVRVSPAEQEALEAAAARKGLPLRAWMRSALVRAAAIA